MSKFVRIVRYDRGAHNHFKQHEVGKELKAETMDELRLILTKIRFDMYRTKCSAASLKTPDGVLIEDVNFSAFNDTPTAYLEHLEKYLPERP